MILGFEERQTPGSVYTPPPGEMILLLANGMRAEPQPMRIIREATRQEWYDGCIAAGATKPEGDGFRLTPFFYEVETD